MKNFIFKSPQDFHKIVFNKLDMVLAEQRHQRMDLAVITRLMNRIINDMNLQKQVDEYFEDDETSPQTERVNNGDNKHNNDNPETS